MLLTEFLSFSFINYTSRRGRWGKRRRRQEIYVETRRQVGRRGWVRVRDSGLEQGRARLGRGWGGGGEGCVVAPRARSRSKATGQEGGPQQKRGRGHRLGSLRGAQPHGVGVGRQQADHLPGLQGEPRLRQPVLGHAARLAPQLVQQLGGQLQVAVLQAVGGVRQQAEGVQVVVGRAACRERV